MQKIRQMDKLIDELANGKTMEKILRLENNAPPNCTRYLKLH